MRSPEDDLATRVFNKKWFAIAWVVFLGAVVTRFWWVRDAALVFSTGDLAPRWADMATGFGFFFIVVFGLSILLIAGLRLYDRWRSTRAAA